MGLDDTFTIALNEVTQVRREDLEYADIAIVVDYEVPVIHLKREKVFPLIAHRQTDGKFYWYRKLRD